MTITKTNNTDEGLKFYTLSEVKLKNGTDNKQVWIIIKDSVYDVTSYLDIHPGGAELILEWAGRDGTKEYQDFGHSSDANKELKKLKIGELVEEDRKANRRKSQLISNVKISEIKKKKKLGGFLFC